MALCAIRVAGVRQTNGSAVIAVARSTRRRELLCRIMDGSIVAGQALLVGNPFAEKARLCDMAGSTLPGEHSVCAGQTACRVHAPVGPNGVPGQEHNRQCGQGDRK